MSTLKKLILIVIVFLTTIVVILSSSYQRSEKVFIKKKVFATVKNSDKYFLGQAGRLYGKAQNNVLILSISYPDVSNDISGYEIMYDGKRLTGKFKLVGTYTINVYERLYYGRIEAVPVVSPVYMRIDNFNYLYRTDKEYLINFLNSIKIVHNLQ